MNFEPAEEVKGVETKLKHWRREQSGQVTTNGSRVIISLTLTEPGIYHVCGELGMDGSNVNMYMRLVFNEGNNVVKYTRSGNGNNGTCTARPYNDLMYCVKPNTPVTVQLQAFCSNQSNVTTYGGVLEATLLFPGAVFEEQ